MDYRQATEKDFNVSINLIRKYLYEIPESEMQDLIENEIVYLAEDHKNSVGIGTGYVASKSKPAFPLGYENFIFELGFDKEKVGVLESSAVSENYRKQGVGEELTRLRVEWLKSQDASKIVCLAWVYPDGSLPAKAQLTANGLKEITRIEGLWNQECKFYSRSCLECGPDCKCTGAVFVLE